MNSRAPDGRRALTRDIFQLVCKIVNAHASFSRPQCFSNSSETKNRIKDGYNRETEKGTGLWWDWKAEEKVHQAVLKMVGSWTGEVWGISVWLREPSVKNPNHFLSLSLSLSLCLSPSLPPSLSPSPRSCSPSQHLLSLSFYLTPSPHRFPSCFSPLSYTLTFHCVSISLYTEDFFLCSSQAKEDKFLMYHRSGNKSIVKEQLVQICQRCSDTCGNWAGSITSEANATIERNVGVGWNVLSPRVVHLIQGTSGVQTEVAKSSRSRQRLQNAVDARTQTPEWPSSKSCWGRHVLTSWPQ